MSTNTHHKGSPQKDKKQSHRQGAFTEDGFYRKSAPYNNHNHSPQQGPSPISQKQSMYEARPLQSIQTGSDNIGYTTLNPTRYEPTAPSLPDTIQDQESQIVIVFQLNREREKNRILEKRLMNKEMHIAKMKEVHNELTEAFEKCQNQLQYYKRKCAQPLDVREYVQEINQLKHLVIRLQDKITEYERRESKRYNSVRQEDHHQSHERAAVRDFRANPGNDSDRVSARAKKQKRSKTVANQQDSPEFRKLDSIEDYVTKYPHRISSFISQFLAMVECFSQEAQEAKRGSEGNGIKRRMKIGWKWIKEVVIEWNTFKNYHQRAVYFHSKLKKIFNVGDAAEDQEVINTILQAIQN